MSQANGTGSSKVGIGIIGCGFISDIYLTNLGKIPNTEVVACADLRPERAIAQAEKYGVPKAVSVEELLADPAVEIVLNLTIPLAHAEVVQAAIAAGKSVYTEKPLSVERDEATSSLAEAKERGLLVGCAPDTFLGGGLQTCRKLIDDGWIGEPVAATAFMLCHGMEHWHPDPAFYYQRGGGPMFDMGPYYLTALVSLLGPVRRVSGSARVSFPERVISSQPRAGEVISVAVPTHLASVLDFAAGPIGTIVTSFDVWHSEVPRLEIYGSEGTLSLPDPNTFGGPVRLRRAGAEEWQEMPLSHPNTVNSRGLGVADLACALRTGRAPRASGEMAAHVLDMMQAVGESSESGKHIELTTSCQRPAPLPLGLPPFTVDGCA